MRLSNIVIGGTLLTLASITAAQGADYQEPFADFTPTSIWNETHWCGEVQVTSPGQELEGWYVLASGGASMPSGVGAMNW